MQVHYLMLSKGLTTAGGASVKHWLRPVAWKRQPAHRIRVTKAMVHDHQTTRVSSMKKFLLSSVALLGFTAGAMAADLPRRAPPVFVPVPVFTWTGFYVGVNAGYGWNNGDDNTCLGCSNDWFATARVRVGYAFDRVLVYATGGIAFTDDSGNNRGFGGFNSGPSFRRRSTSAPGRP